MEEGQKGGGSDLQRVVSGVVAGVVAGVVSGVVAGAEV